MRRVFASVMTVGIAAAAAAQETPPAFVDVELPKGPVWAGQHVEILVRIGYDEAFFRESGVPVFQRRTELPFQLVVPWSDEGAVPAGVRTIVVPNGELKYRYLTVGDSEVWVAEIDWVERGGRTFQVLGLHRPWTALLPGEHVLEPVVLRYAYATRFEETLLGGRQPVDRHDATAAAPRQQLVVRALPAGGPAEFSGAVGTFQVQAEAFPREIELGDTITLALAVSGDGNLFRPPPWPELAGFVVQGLVTEPSTGWTRRFLFDVLAVRAGAEIGPLGFTYFDPVAGEYRTARTAPVALRVLPLPAGRELPPRVRALLDADVATLAQSRAVPWQYHAALLAAVLSVLGFWRRSRRRQRRRDGHERAVAELAERLQAGPDAACAAFEACCTAWSGAADASHLSVAGVPEPLVARAHALHAALAAARYGGKPPPADEVLDVARQIVAALR